jgi:hypothetical protein
VQVLAHQAGHFEHRDLTLAHHRDELVVADDVALKLRTQIAAASFPSWPV